MTSMSHPTTASRLNDWLECIVQQLTSLISEVPIKHFEGWNDLPIIALYPDYYWGELSPDQRSKQMKIKREYENWYELLRVCLSLAPDDVLGDLETADVRFRRWIELDSKSIFSLTPDPEKNVGQLLTEMEAYKELLHILEAAPDKGIIVIPDTSSLLESCDPVEYRSVVGGDSFRFILLPTVFEELEKIKIYSKNSDIREQAKRVTKRIKGWLKQGHLLNGVTVDETIQVVTRSKEPDMESTVSWLKSDVKDDRIIASVLEIQTESPAAHVVLVTGDINLQNKADAAAISVAEPPK